MKIDEFIEALEADFFVGVPDSQLKVLCNYLMQTYGINKKHHIIAANEDNAVAIAAGYNLATGKVPVVYLQNSGEGNIINPIVSLTSPKVYGIPEIFIVGLRGEPNLKDEPQHKFQGEITLKLLEDIQINYFIIDKETGCDDLVNTMNQFKNDLRDGRSIAFVIKKDAFIGGEKIEYKNKYKLTREDAIECIVKNAGEDLIVSTTGKTSRELYEIRERRAESHNKDFLTVGSMGHASSIALGIALSRPDKKVWCIDGDGAMLMHMGAMSVIGNLKVENYIHIVINNGAHESAGGQPTMLKDIDISKIAKVVGYEYIGVANDITELDNIIKNIRKYPVLIEVRCAIKSRKDLGRPKLTPYDNKKCLWIL